jgi:hypothetical protein
MLRSTRPLRLEMLESRRTPATLVDAKTVTFQDVDGDAATIVFSKPVFTDNNKASVLIFDTGFGADNTTKQQLQTIDLTALPAGLSVTVTAKSANGGDGKVNVGFVNADGKDEGNLTIGGDLGRVIAGDAMTKTRGLAALTVGSLGVQGIATQEAGGDLNSQIAGALGKLSVTGDVNAAFVSVNGSIGPVQIGGSLLGDTVNPLLSDSGEIQAQGSIGKVSIVGDVVGGLSGMSGAINANGNISSVSIGGSLKAGGGFGGIDSGLRVGKVNIGGDITAATGSGSMDIEAGDLASLTVAGNVIGGAGVASARVEVQGNLGAVKIGGNLVGGLGDESAEISAFGAIASVVVAGDVTGGDGGFSAAIEAERLGPVEVKSLSGGDGDLSGQIDSSNGIAKVTVHGNVAGGAGTLSASIKGAKVGPVTISGNFSGGDGLSSAAIQSDTRLGTVHITGNAVGGAGQFSAEIEATDITGVSIDGAVAGGSGQGSACIVAIHSVGQIKVGGNWTAASIAAGENPGPDGYFGTADDVAAATPGKIAGITIVGKVDGTAAAGDQFAFEAAQITSASIDGQKLALKAGALNDNMALGANGDFLLIEK